MSGGMASWTGEERAPQLPRQLCLDCAADCSCRATTIIGHGCIPRCSSCAPTCGCRHRQESLVPDRTTKGRVLGALMQIEAGVENAYDTLAPCNEATLFLRDLTRITVTQASALEDIRRAVLVLRETVE